MFKIQTLNKISSAGLERFPRDDYEIASSINDPDAILVRSQDMHGMTIPDTVKAVARAGAGRFFGPWFIVPRQAVRASTISPCRS